MEIVHKIIKCAIYSTVFGGGVDDVLARLSLIKKLSKISI